MTKRWQTLKNTAPGMWRLRLYEDGASGVMPDGSQRPLAEITTMTEAQAERFAVIFWRRRDGQRGGSDEESSDENGAGKAD